MTNTNQDTRPAWWRQFEGRDLPDLTFEPMPLTQVLDNAAARYPHRKAVVFQNLTWTYSELKAKAETLAASLRMRGINPGDRVAIMLPNLPQTIVALWGIFKAGAVAVMTNPLYMEKELTHHFDDSKVKVLITLDLLWPKIAPLWDKLGLKWCAVTRIADGLSFPLNVLQPLQAKRAGHVPEIHFDGERVVRWSDLMSIKMRFAAEYENPQDSIALLQYTGGTTGLSKAAMLTHGNLSAQMKILQAIIGGDASSKKFTFLSIMPFFHVFGLVGNIILPALYASSSIPVPRYTPADLLQTIQKYRPNFFIGAPSVYISLMQQKNISKFDLTCIELCISGSAPFPKEAMTRFQNLTGANITEGLGLTEASPVVCANPLYGLQKIGSVGVPVPNTELRIVDTETGTTVLGDNQPGELIVKGPQVMAGYWNRPDETAKTLRDGWLYTGDIAYRDEDGYYFIVDRKKDMAIVGGYNVYPHEVDEVLYEHPKVAEAVAVAVPHKTRGEILKAYIVPKEGETISVPELTSFCKERLANYKVPRQFEFRTELPKTLVGKVLRRALREEEERKLREPEAELMEKAIDSASEMADKTSELAVKANKIADKTAEIMETSINKAAEFTAITKEKMAELGDRAEPMIRDTTDRISEITKDTTEKISEITNDLKEKTDQLLHQEKLAGLSEITRDTAEKLAEITNELKNRTEQLIRQTRSTGMTEKASSTTRDTDTEPSEAAASPDKSAKK